MTAIDRWTVFFQAALLGVGIWIACGLTSLNSKIPEPLTGFEFNRPSAEVFQKKRFFPIRVDYGPPLDITGGMDVELDRIDVNWPATQEVKVTN